MDNKNNYPSPHTADRIVAGIIDVQNDFIDGSLAVPDGVEVVSPLNRLMAFTRHRGKDDEVVLTKDWHPKETPHFDKWPVHCVEKTRGAQLHDRLFTVGDTVLYKGVGDEDGYSGFDGTNVDGDTLEKIITPRNPKERVAFILGGLATDYCVKATALDAARISDEIRKTGKGIIDIYLLLDAIRAVDLEPGDGDKAIQEMKDAGVHTITTTDLFGQWGQLG